jgi:hypothetical protein
MRAPPVKEGGDDGVVTIPDGRTWAGIGHV